MGKKFLLLDPTCEVDGVPGGCRRKDATCQGPDWCRGVSRQCGWPELKNGGRLDRPDPACVDLCVALNTLPGIKTTESCSGHGTQPYRVWFQVTDFTARGLLALSRFVCPRYYPDGWRIVVDHGDTIGQQLGFLLEGPVNGDLGAQELAMEIQNHVQNRMDGYNILTDTFGTQG